MTPADIYRQRAIDLVGGDPTRIQLGIAWTNRDEGKNALVKLRGVQRDLKSLKREINATISAIKSEYTTARAEVGRGVGAFLVALLGSGKRSGNMGIRRERLRREAINETSPYQDVTVTIDKLIAHIDTVKHRIEASPAYQVAAKVPRRIRTSGLPTSLFYVYIDGIVKGPFTKEQLTALAEVGTITASTQVCEAGTETWTQFGANQSDG